MKGIFFLMFVFLNSTSPAKNLDPCKLNSSVKAIIFDCDGTLVDSEQAHFSAWRYAFQRQGQELSTQVYSTFIGKGTKHVLKMAVEIIGFDCSEELEHDKNSYFSQLQLNGLPPIHSTIQFLHSLFLEKEARNVKLAVASGARREEIIQNLKSLGIENYFDLILSGLDDLADYTDPTGTNKPKPYIYLKAAKLLECQAHECIAIEDSESGVTSAFSAGCITIAIPNEYTRHHDLSKADLQIESLANITIEDFLENIAKMKASSI
jgi:HAD superfamily hydrolase (TIGR01509 family)